MKPINERVLEYIHRHEIKPPSTLLEAINLAIRVSVQDDEELQAREIHAVVKDFVAQKFGAVMLECQDAEMLEVLQKLYEGVTSHE